MCKIGRHSGEWSPPGSRCEIVKICDFCGKLEEETHNIWVRPGMSMPISATRLAGASDMAQRRRNLNMSGDRSFIRIASSTRPKSTHVNDATRPNGPVACQNSAHGR
jgi:hypothetical protein